MLCGDIIKKVYGEKLYRHLSGLNDIRRISFAGLCMMESKLLGIDDPVRNLETLSEWLVNVFGKEKAEEYLSLLESDDPFEPALRGVINCIKDLPIYKEYPMGAILLVMVCGTLGLNFPAEEALVFMGRAYYWHRQLSCDRESQGRCYDN